MSPTPRQMALWANQIQRECLLEAGGDVDAGLAAAEFILATQPIPHSLDTEFLDITLAGFDPNQPRKPVGDPEGGEWVAVGGLHVNVANDGTILRGKLKGKNIKDVKKHIDSLPTVAHKKEFITKVHNPQEFIDSLKKYTPDEARALGSNYHSTHLIPPGGIKEFPGTSRQRRDTVNKVYSGEILYESKTVDPKELVFVQKFGVEEEKVLDMVKQGPPSQKLRDSGLTGVPVALRGKDGKLYLLDGNHRAMWAMAYGEPIRVLVTNQIADKNQSLSIDAFLAHDVHNRQAQGILNRSLKAARGLSTNAKKDLATALKHNPNGIGGEILAFIQKYRLQLAKLLTTTQLAAVLEGAVEVAAKVPTLATFPGAVAPPPTLEPQEAVKLVSRLERTKDAVERAEIIADLPSEQQQYARQAIIAKEAYGGLPPPSFTSPVPPAGSPEEVHFLTINEAVRNLAERNVMDRQRYDALDAAARAKAFMVANISAEETLTKIRDSLSENVRQGADYETWREKVLEDVDQGTFLSDSHQENVFRTNIQTAFSDGQATVLSHPLVRSGFPYANYDAIHDDRVRENHLALESLGIQGTNTYRIDDPVFQLFRPPWDYQDRCGWTPITVRQAAEKGIKEAQEWLHTGVEPAQKAFVPMPDFRPPEGFQRAVASAPLSIQLSMQPMASFGFDPNEKRDEGGKWTAGGSGSSIDAELSEASEAWFDYDMATAIKEASKDDGDLDSIDVQGEPLSEDDKSKARKYAIVIQQSASSSQTTHKRVFRGIVIKDTAALDSLFPKGKKVAFTSLSAASPQQDIASIYHDVENAGGEGIPVMIHVENSNGVVGHMREDGGEIILPKGAEYRVARKEVDVNGLWTVVLYSSEKVKKQKKLSRSPTSTPLSITLDELSMQPIAAFGFDPNQKRDEEGKFVADVLIRERKKDRLVSELTIDSKSIGEVEILTDLKPIATMENLEIWEEHRGKGHARRLYKKTFDYLRRHGFTEVHSSENLQETGEAVWRSLQREIPEIKYEGGVYQLSLQPDVILSIAREDHPCLDWAEYVRQLNDREEWSERDEDRTECRKCVEEAVKLFRMDDPDLDEVDDLLARAGATGAELRVISRMRHRVTKGDPPEPLEDLYEEVAESIHRRLDADVEVDKEPDDPEEPTSLATSLSANGEDRSDRDELIAEILVILYGDRSEEVAGGLRRDTDSDDDDIALAVGNPKVKRRYGKKPGPGWIPGGVSSKGVAIWLHGAAPAHAAAPAPTPHTPAPVAAPTPPVPAPAPATPTSTFTPVPTPLPSTLPAGGQRARAASITAYNTAMAKLSSGQALTAADKASLATKLTNMPTPLLTSLHTALGGTAAVAGSKNTVAAVRAILTGGTPAPPAPTPAPQTFSTGYQGFDDPINDLLAGKLVANSQIVSAVNLAHYSVANTDVVKAVTALGGTVSNPNSGYTLSRDLNAAMMTANARNTATSQTPASPTPAPTGPTPKWITRPPLATVAPATDGNGPPGPPPRPGLVWNPNTHRWTRPGIYEPPAPRLGVVGPYNDPTAGGPSTSGGIPATIDHKIITNFQNDLPSLTSTGFTGGIVGGSVIAKYTHGPSGYTVIASQQPGYGAATTPDQTRYYDIHILDGTGGIVSKYKSRGARDEAYINGRAIQVAHWLEGEIKRTAGKPISSSSLAQFAWEYARPGTMPFKLADTDWGDAKNRGAVEGFLKSTFPKLIGAQQNSPHAGLDTVEHTMNIVNPLNLRTSGLSARDAEILRLGMTFHDVGKQHGPMDHEHPRKSAVDAEPLLWQFGLSEKEVHDTLAVIKWHDAYGDALKAGGGSSRASKIAKLAYEYTDDALAPDARKAEALRINNLLMRAWQSDLATIPGLTADPIPGRPDLSVYGSVHVDVDGPAFEKVVSAEINKLTPADRPKAAPLPKKPATPTVGTDPPYLVASGCEWGELVQRTDKLLIGPPVPYDSTVAPPKEVYNEAHKHPDLNYARAFNMGYDGPTGQITTISHGTRSAYTPNILSAGMRPGHVNAFGHGVYAFLNGTDEMTSTYASNKICIMEVHTGRCIDHKDLERNVYPAWAAANPAEDARLRRGSNNGHLTAAALAAGYSSITLSYYGGEPAIVVLDPARIRLKSVVGSRSGGYKGETVNTTTGNVKFKKLPDDEKKIPASHPEHIKMSSPSGRPKGWAGTPRTT